MGNWVEKTNFCLDQLDLAQATGSIDWNQTQVQVLKVKCMLDSAGKDTPIQQEKGLRERLTELFLIGTWEESSEVGKKFRNKYNPVMVIS